MASETTCEPCQSENVLLPAIKWCMQCEESLCIECEKSHRKNKASRQHTLVDILSKDEFTKITVRSCRKHEDEQNLELFCIDHDELCCRVCLTENHRACAKVVPLHVAANDVKSSAMLDHVLEQADMVKTRLGESLTHLRNENGNLKRHEKQLVDEVLAYKRHVMEWLDESEAFLKTEIQQICSSRNEKITKIQQLLTEKEDNMKSHLNVLKKSINSDANEQTFLLAQNLKLLIEESVKVMEKKTSEIQDETMRFIANGSTDFSEKALGKIEVTHQDTNDFQICLQSLAAQSCRDNPILNVNSHITKSKIVMRSEFKLESCTNAQVRGIVVTEDGNILVCNHSRLEVQRYLPNGQYVDSCDVQRYPWNIAILDNCSHAVVSLTGNLALASMISMSGHLRIIDIKKMVNIREIKLGFVPLAVTTSNNEILIGTWNKIQFLKQDGVFVKDLSLQWNKCAVTYLHVDAASNDMIYYSASELYRIGKDGSDSNKLDCISGRPRGICSDNKGYIYTATTEGKLFRLFPDGRLSDTLLDGTEGYGRLWAIAFNLDYTKLYVSTRNGKSLSVFEFK